MMRNFEFHVRGKDIRSAGVDQGFKEVPIPTPTDPEVGIVASARLGAFGTLGSLLMTYRLTTNDPNYYNEPSTVCRFLEFNAESRTVGRPFSVLVTGWAAHQLLAEFATAGLRVYEDHDLEKWSDEQ